MAHGDVMRLQLLHPPTSDMRGGFVTVRTDQNGQATVTFPDPFPAPPASIIATPGNNLIVVGTLVLTESYVMLWVWDIVSNGWCTDTDVDLYWLGVFSQ